jgi:hypothetical protein
MTWKNASPKPKPSNGEVFNIQCTKPLTADTGARETRTCWATPLPKVIAEQAERWKDFRSIAMIEALREIHGQSTLERRYYITSLPAEATVILCAARGALGN